MVKIENMCNIKCVNFLGIIYNIVLFLLMNFCLFIMMLFLKKNNEI